MRLPAALLALLVLTAGCSAFSDGAPPSDQRALDVRNQTLAAAENVSTYRFVLDAGVTASDDTNSRSVGVTGTGAVDRQAHRMVSNVTTDGETRSVFVTDGTVYTECADPWDGWGTRNVSEETEWTDTAPLGRQMLLLDRSNVYYEGNRTLDGNRTVLVVTHPSKQTLTSLPDATGRSAVDYSDANIENTTFKVWVDPRTYRPVQTALRIQTASGDASATVRVRTHYRDWNAPTDIATPDIDGEIRHEFGCPGS